MGYRMAERKEKKYRWRDGEDTRTFILPPRSTTTHLQCLGDKYIPFLDIYVSSGSHEGGQKNSTRRGVIALAFDVRQPVRFWHLKETTRCLIEAFSSIHSAKYSSLYDDVGPGAQLSP